MVTNKSNAMSTYSNPENIGQQINLLKSKLQARNHDKETLKLILSCIDLTTLEGSDTEEKVKDLCAKARGYESQGLPNVAAVCVYPNFARLVRRYLQGSGVQTASVAGAFPSGQSKLSIRLDEVRYAVDEGAEEIDMVISRGHFLQGNYDFILEEVSKTKEACGSAHLKVILETGELVSFENIRKASDLAMEAGADFIKTSTGKIQPAATPEAFLIMLEAIRDHHQKTKKMVGIKPAGGIAEPDQALLYAAMVEHVLGQQWLNNKLFRVGASRLTDNISNLLR
jgi:deoxyribose-phosphate aldolase